MLSMFCVAEVRHQRWGSANPWRCGNPSSLALSRRGKHLLVMRRESLSNVPLFLTIQLLSIQRDLCGLFSCVQATFCLTL